jgi:hypothetical protein
LLNKIVHNNILFELEVACVRDDPENIFYEYRKCKKISVYNFITSDSFFLIPSKYGVDKEKYITDNFYIPSKKLTLRQKDIIKKVNDSKTVKDFIDEFNRLNTLTCNNIIEDEIMNVVLATLNAQTHPSQKSINNNNNCCTLTHDNILEEAISYYYDNNTKIVEIVEVLKMMLNSSKYILSDDFKKNKLDLKDIQFKFKMMTSPESISRDDILVEVFNIDNSISLI